MANYAGLQFNKNEFVALLKASQQFKIKINNKTLNHYFKSLIADFYFKDWLSKPNNDKVAFINHIHSMNNSPPIESLDFLSEDFLISIINSSQCQFLNIKKISSQGMNFLQKKFLFKSVNDFLSNLVNICYEPCPTLSEKRKKIINDRSKLKMAVTRHMTLSVPGPQSPESELKKSVEIYLKSLSRQKRNSLQSTFVKYDGQMGIDAGGVKRDFYHRILEYLQDPPKRNELADYGNMNLGKTMAMQVGVEEGIPGFHLDLDESYYQAIVEKMTSKIVVSKFELMKDFQYLLCSENTEDKYQVKYFLDALSEPESFLGSEVNEESDPMEVLKMFESFFNGLQIESVQKACGYFEQQDQDQEHGVGGAIHLPKAPVEEKHKEFAEGFLSIVNLEKIMLLFPINAKNLKVIIEGDPTPDGEMFIQNHLFFEGLNEIEKVKFKSVLKKYFESNGVEKEKQKIQVAKLLTFATGSSQIMKSEKVTFTKNEGSGFFQGHTCHRSVDCFADILQKDNQDEILEILSRSIDEGLASGMELH
jgi:hypothetical protein